MTITFLELVVLDFLLIISFCLVLLVIRGDTQDKVFQKIIGGLVVFVIALFSKETPVVLVSLFIGGLIIASERFLQSLAAILRTDSKTMPGTLAMLNGSVDIKAATTEEVEIENKKEVDNEENKAKGSSKPHLGSDSNRIPIEERQNIKDGILKLLKEKYKECFTENLKLENEYGQIIVDGAVHLSVDAGKLNLSNVLGLVDIEYILFPEYEDFFERRVRAVLQKIRYLFITKYVLIVFFTKGMTEARATQIKARLESIYKESSDKKNGVVYGFINISASNKPEIIYLPDLKTHVL